MFGGLAFLLDGRMFCGIVKGELMVRVGPERYERVLERPKVRPMDFTDRQMKGMVYVAAAGLRGQALKRWVDRSVDALRASPPPRPKAHRRGACSRVRAGR